MRGHWRACCGLALLLIFGERVFGESLGASSFLLRGDLVGGEKALSEAVKKNAADDQARFELGVVQFLRGIERWGQGLYRYGALSDQARLVRQVPLIRFPTPPNPAPEAISYQDVRRLMAELVDDLGKAERTLSEVKDKGVKLPLQFALIRLDINGNGRGEENEALWQMFATLNRGSGLNEKEVQERAEKFEIAFDYGDVLWLRGYCHLLSALSDMGLAYDMRDLFQVMAPFVFAKVEATEERAALIHKDFSADIADSIAMIHLARFPLAEAKRMEAAHRHMIEVIRLSRETWKAIEAETDDDREWIPSPRQANVVLGVRVTKEMVAGWHEFLDEAEKALEGKLLIDHWRFADGEGVNLKRVFTEPREFDLVLWAQGMAALPYREKGEVADGDTWRRFNRLFGGEFIGFAIWFN